jgi:RNA polymerase sigma factor (sigma-70 family)
LPAAEEISQETMSIVVQAVRENRIHSPGSIGAYVFRVAENLVKKRFKEKKRRSQEIPPDTLEPQWLDSPEAGLLLQEKRSHMRRALAELEEADRRLLVRCYTDDEPLEKIAEAMGISYPALRKRKSRALEKLRRIYFDVTKGKKRTLSKREQDGRGVLVDFSKETLK